MQTSDDKKMSSINKLIGGGIAGFLLLLGFLLTFYTVDQYERAVLTRFGHVVQVSEPGLHFRARRAHLPHGHLELDMGFQDQQRTRCQHVHR